MRTGARFLMIMAAAILATTLGATSSLAVTATTWTVHPGGRSSGSNSFFAVKDTNTSAGFACTSSSLSVTFKSGSGLPGNGLGSVTSIRAAHCQMPAGYGFVFSDRPYVFSASSYSSGTTTGRITGIHATGAGPGCTFVIDGTSATAKNGSIVVTYSNSTGKLKLRSGGNLHFYDVSGCFGLLGSGDHVTLNFSQPYNLSPQQTIISP